AFTQRQIEIALGIEIQGARSVQRRAGQIRSVRRGFLLACSCICIDRSRLEIDTADAVVADIANQQLAFRIECDAMRLLKLRLGRRTAITGEPGSAGSSCGGDLLS